MVITRLLSKDQLLERVVGAIKMSGGIPLVERHEHPFLITAAAAGSAQALCIYAWNLSPGGPEGVRPTGEYRIQLTGVASIDVLPGRKTLLLGWDETRQVFVAFDPARHAAFGASPSIQIPSSMMGQATQSGTALHRRTNGEVCLAFTPPEFLRYVRVSNEFHGLSDPDIGGGIVEAAVRSSRRRVTRPPPRDAPTERERAVHIVESWLRDAAFREGVMRAYHYRCSVCQLDEQLPQAAHIVPVRAPGSVDLVTNGVSLCPNHHSAYDLALLGIAPDYRVAISPQVMAGSPPLHPSTIDQLVKWDGQRILLPDDSQDWPSPDYLAEGLKLRKFPGFY